MQSPAENDRAKSRHRAVAGVLAAVILFAAIFSIGVSFFLFVSQSAHSADQANVANANNLLQASQEKLLVTAGVTSGTDSSCKNCIWVGANNTGGVVSSIIDLYVTCMSRCGGSGQLLSNSHFLNGSLSGSHFLKQNPDLNVTLPITLDIGASTGYLPSCPRAECRAYIRINKIAFNYMTGEYVVVSLLTSMGNVFSAQYPPSPNPVTNYTTVKKVTNEIVLTQIGGGPQLSVMMQATPTQTLSCSTSGCINLTATVYNQARWTAANVSISLNAPSASGTASVWAYSSCSPASHSVAINSSWRFTCLFSASTGAVGGFVSFSGHATGTLNGVLVTSADSLSNSVEVGGIASVTTQGAFAANFFFLRYSSCTQSSATQHSFVGPCITNISPLPMTLSNLPSGSYLAGGSNYYTAWYIKITNVFNTTLPITQYSYLFGDPDISGEYFNFLVGTNTSSTNGVYYPYYGANPPTLVGYPKDCNKVGSNNRPTDSKCIYVNPGQTVTLTFAACGYGATNWGWGGKQDASGFDSNSNNGCTSSAPSLSVPEGMSLGIVVSFGYKGGNYSQLMPFEGLALLRSTSTAVSCSPSPVSSSGSTTCTATVTDTDGGSFSYGPTGTVTFSAAPAGYGGLSPVSCTLSSLSSTSASCSVIFTPNGSGVGAVTIQGSYGGDSYHMASSGSTAISLVYSTTTTVICTPVSFMTGSTSQCTATLTGFKGSVAGEPITWSQSAGTGSVSFSPTACGLSAGGTCSVTVTGTGAGSPTIQASYAGDSTNGASSGTATVTVTKALTAPVIASSTVPTISLDTACQGFGSSTTATVTTGSITCAANDVIIVVISGASSNTVSSMTDSLGTHLTYTARCSNCDNHGSESVEEYYAITSSSATFTITATMSGTASYDIYAFGIKGANTASPFDSDFTANNLPNGHSYNSGTESVSGVSTANANDMIIGLEGHASSTLQTAVSPFALIGTAHTTNTQSIAAEYETVSATQSGITVSFGQTSGGAWSMLVDAVQASTSSGAIDSGQSATLYTTTSFSGGISPYTCQWLEEAPGATTYSHLGSSFSCAVGDLPTTSTGSLSTTGTWSFELQVTDSASVVVTSNVATVTVNPALTLSVPTPAAIDSGQTATLTATASGGSGTYSTYAWYSGTCTGTALQSGASASYTTAALTATTTYCVKVTDSLGGTATTTVTVTVNPALTISVPTPAAIDSGQTTTLTATAAGGSGTYSTYAWYTSTCSGTALQSGTSNTYTTAALTATTTYCVKVTDSLGGTATTTVTVTVNPALTISVPTPAAIDSGQTTTLTATAAGGSGTYSTYAWYSGTCTGTALQSGASKTYTTAALTATTTYCVKVTDSLGGTATTTVTVTVNPALTLSVPGVTIDNGQTTTLTATAAGGSGTYSTYAWYTSTCTGTALQSGTSNTYTTAALTATTTYCVKVTDSLGGTATTTVTVTVNSKLVAPTASSSPGTVDQGQSSSLTSTAVTTGTSPYTYQWLEEAPGATSYSTITGATSSSYTFSTSTSTTTGTYHFELQVTDSASAVVTSNAVTVAVNAAPTVSVSTPPAIDSGQTATLTAAPSGGSGTGYTYAWYSGTSCSGTVFGTSASYTTAALTATTTYCVKVTDSLGGTATTTVTVTVNPALTLSVPGVTIDNGQTTTLTATAAGGSGTYSTYAWYTSTCTGTALQSGTSKTYTTAALTATTTYCVKVTDSLGGTTTTTVTVTVNPALTGVTLGSFATNPVGASASDSISVSWSGGTSTFTVTLYYSTSSTSCSSANTQAAQLSGVSTSPTTVTFTAPSSAGTYYYCATVTDSVGGSAASSTSGRSLTVASNKVLVWQSASNGCAGQSTCSSGSESTTSGDLLVVTISYYGSTARTISTVSDGHNSYSLAISESPSGTYANRMVSAIYYSVATYTGSATLTVTLSGSPSTAFSVVFAEFSGNWGSSPLTATNYGTCTTGTSCSASLTTTSSTSYGTATLLIGASATHGSHSLTVGPGFTGFSAGATNACTTDVCAEYVIPSSAGSTTFPATSTGSDDWVDVGAVFTDPPTSLPAIFLDTNFHEMGNMNAGKIALHALPIVGSSSISTFGTPASAIPCYAPPVEAAGQVRLTQKETYSGMTNGILPFETWIQNTERIYSMNEAKGKV